MRRWSASAVGFVALAVGCQSLAAVSASASTITRVGDVYTYSGQGDSIDNALVITSSSGLAPDVGDFHFTDNTTITATGDAVAACAPNSGTTVTCDANDVTGIVGIAGAGHDSLAFVRGPGGPPVVPLTFEGDTGDDTLTGGPLNDVLNGDDDDGTTADDGADRINGGAGNDEIDGQGGSDPELDGEAGLDQVSGGAGDDAITGGIENDTVDGGAGSGDRIAYNETGRTGGVTVDLADATAGTKDGGAGETTEDALGFEHVTGSAAADVIAGDAQANLLDGGGGDDELQGRDGADTLSGQGAGDTLIGGPHDDLLLGGPGADTFNGGAGTDTISYVDATRTEGVTVTLGSGAGDDGSALDADTLGVRDTVTAIEILNGSRQADRLRGDALANTLIGDTGDDVLQGAGGGDTLRGSDGIDTTSYAERAVDEPVVVTLDGAPGDGAVNESDDVGSDVENATGGAGTDTLTGGDGPTCSKVVVGTTC